MCEVMEIDFERKSLHLTPTIKNQFFHALLLIEQLRDLLRVRIFPKINWQLFERKFHAEKTIHGLWWNYFDAKELVKHM